MKPEERGTAPEAAEEAAEGEAAATPVPYFVLVAAVGPVEPEDVAAKEAVAVNGEEVPSQSSPTGRL